MIRPQVVEPQGGYHAEVTRPVSVNLILKNSLKRIFDIGVSFISIILLSPLLALIAILIRRDSPGPIFYWGPRAGMNGKPFRILKFRTMFERPESYAGPRVTAQGDDRITPLGAWLRYTKINELPQLWNVLIGQMSMVGPRPEDVDIAQDWPEEARSEILSVRPGITSPASVLYHDEEKLLNQNSLMEDYFQSILPDKMRLDRLYVRYHSFFTDIDIIFWTIAVVIPRLASAKIPEGYLFAGPFSRLVNRYVNWFLVDCLVAFIAVGISSLFWSPVDSDGWGFNELATLALLLAFVFSSINVFSGLNRIMWSRSTSEDGVSLLISGLMTQVFTLVLIKSAMTFDWVSLPHFPSGMLFMIGVLATFGFVLARYRLRLATAIANRWLKFRQNDMAIGERVLIIGAGEGGQIAGWLLKRRMFRTAFSIVGMVDDIDPTSHGMRVGGYWMLGGITDLTRIVEKDDIGVILSTIPATNPKLDEYIFDFCRANGIRLIFLDDLLHMVDKQVTQPANDADHPIWRAEYMEFKAVHDITTQLPNRYLLQDRLRHSLSYSRRYNTRVSVLFIDLDDLPSINDTLGRKYGDEVLVKAARRLSHSKRESDTLARFGEHQFALILENLSKDCEMDMIVRRIHASLTKPFQINGHRFIIEPHIGVCHDNDVTDPAKVDITTFYKNKTIVEVKPQHEYVVAK